jgi:glycerophosphoryl diester phosphodiesterase
MTRMSLGWLAQRPIAHRGLHDAAAGIIENTGPAFSAAIAAGYGIECDLQISADGEAMVHHDDALGRLTEGSGKLAAMSAAAIKQVRYKAGDARILDLGELCALVGGRVPLFLELKSRFDGDLRLARRAMAALSSYAGPAALMSFDPAPVEEVRRTAPALPRGIIAQRHYDDWPGLTPALRRSLAYFMHLPRTRPHFIAYAVKDLPAAAPLLARNLLRLPLLTWTVRSPADGRRALRWADQIIFEGWRP